MTWTDDRISRLKNLWREGKSASEIADLLGDVSRNAVIGKSHRLNLAGRPSPIIRRQARPMPVDDRKQCAWLDGHSGDWQPCSAPAEPGRSYCSEHLARSLRRPDPRTGKPNQMDTFSGKRRKTAGGRV